MELRGYWITIRRQRMVILLCAVLAVCAAGLLTWQATPQYKSSARLFVSTTDSDASSAYQNSLFATQRVTSYANLARSRQLAERVSATLDGSPDPDVLRSAVSATVVPDTVILQLMATDPDPVLARDIAQAYAEGLSELVTELETPSGKTDATIKVSIVDSASVPEAPFSPQPVRDLGLALILGLLVGVGVVVLREVVDTSISSAEDVAEVTEAPILGHINTDAAASKLAPAEALGNATPWAEGFRVLRTNMQYVEVDRDQKVFVVTSPLPSEGKTTTAINLAITLAMANQSVALVECDLRRPVIATRLGLDGGIGTTGVLIGKFGLEDAIQSYGDAGLMVLPSGPIPPNPSELLQSKAMEKLLADLRERFDVVVVDTPPLLPVTDAALITAQADGALLVVRHGRTTRDQLAHALERIASVDATTVGVVINLAPARRGGYSYGYAGNYKYVSGPHAGTGRTRQDPPRRRRAPRDAKP